MPTPNSSAASLLTPAEFLKRADANTVGQLCSDTKTPVDPVSLLTNPVLQAALDDAQGDVEAYCLKGNYYQPADLAALTGVGQKRLFRLLARLALGYLYERRPNFAPVSPQAAQAREDLEALSRGEQIFGLAETQAAGEPSHYLENAGDVQARNGVAVVASRFFGQRTNQIWPVTGAGDSFPGY